ncbi:MAG: NADH-quinone oxidoreductase subunit J [Pirellulales bacterium]|jgi:NADH-quinone oxidoreductase subunit J|nr:NADH-quinone oxidoreductase subunit J [Pirellulales bacterium]
MGEINGHTLLFLFFGLLTCLFSLAVVFSANVVRMAFYLILALAATSGLHFLAGADFVGAMQLVLYVGGTLVLLVFGVMLTAQNPFISLRTAGGDWVVAAMVGGILLVILIPVAFQVGLPPSEDSLLDGRVDREAIASTDPVSVPTATRIGLGLLGVPGDDVSGYLLPFEIISIHLLVVLVGAAYLARAKRRVAVSDAQGAQDGMES